MNDELKFICSSKHLYRKLAEVDLDAEPIERFSASEGEVTLITKSRSIKIGATITKFKAAMKMDYGRWDWVKKLMMQCDEQPIVLTIHENGIRISFDY